MEIVATEKRHQHLFRVVGCDHELWLDLLHPVEKQFVDSVLPASCLSMFTCVLQVLLPAAGLLQLQDVKKTCCEFLESQLHPVNCLGIRAFADMHACTDLLNKANTYAGKWNRPGLSLKLGES